METNNAFLSDEHLQEVEDIRLKDLLTLSIERWRWFVLSLTVFLGCALVYLCRTTPLYTRSISIMIKEDAKKGSNSLTSELSGLSEMGVYNENANVNNELISIQSPDLIKEVIRRLKFDVNYKTDGTFHKEALYGLNLPLKVEFKDIAENDYCKCKITIREDGTLRLSGFVLNGQKMGDDVTAKPDGNAVNTPVGKIKITKSPYWQKTAKADMNIYVERSGLIATMSSTKGRMTASLNNKSATVIDITYNDICIQRAEDFLNTLISVYNEGWIADKIKIAMNTSQFLNERLEVIRNELGCVDSDISNYKSTNLIPDVVSSSQMYMNTANLANVEITNLQNQLFMAHYIRDFVGKDDLRNQLLPANSGIGSSAIEQQINDYNAKMLQRISLVGNSGEDNPLVIDMDKNLSEMRKAILLSIDNQIGTLNAQIRGFRGIEGGSNSRLSNNPKQEKYLISEERQQKVKEALYLYLLQKREENELSQAFTAYNNRVINKPTGTMQPTSPNRKCILLVALLLGFLLPVAVIYFREFTNTKVRKRKDLADLTIPFIGEIPYYVRQKSKLPWDSFIRSGAKVGEVIVQPSSRNLMNEAFRIVRTNMELLNIGESNQKVMMVTSCNSNSGKTFLAINTAASFAIKQQKVAVIDLDMRHASLSGYVHSPQKGIVDYLNGTVADWHSIVAPVDGFSTLDVIPVGTIPSNPVELLLSQKLQLMINDLRQEYDIIFIDCPPVEIVADTNIINQLADITLFVVCAGITELEALPALEGYYRDHKFNNMLLLLNGTIASGSHYVNKYGYIYAYKGK